jgi:uncharacterized phage protein (TIGR01671 family)
MNRPVKFRVWNLFTQKWVKLPKRFQQHNDGLCYFGGTSVYLQKKRYILQQYTGLRDSKSTEIYEGDILEFDGGPHDMQDKYIVEVKWDDEIAAFEAYSSEYVDFLRNIENPTIIGNIFENPKLLK